MFPSAHGLGGVVPLPASSILLHLFRLYSQPVPPGLQRASGRRSDTLQVQAMSTALVCGSLEISGSPV